MKTCAPAWVLALLLGAASARAGDLRYCDHPPVLDAAQQDRLLRVTAVARAALDASGARAVLVARSGLDLARLGVRYSHAGLSLRAHPDAAWTVRQLYYACDERRPRLFDQGLAGFVMGMGDPAQGHLSLLLLPAEAAARLERTALDAARALALLGDAYSANAYPFSTRYQNCNQWLAELIASAWDEPEGLPVSRAAAQSWLIEQDYRPHEFRFSPWLVAAGTLFVPWLHADDHPAADRIQVSLPESIETFVRGWLPGVERIELCHTAERVVLRRGWKPIDEGCVAAAGDAVTRFEPPAR